jgi:hypothetical protein
LQITTLFTAFHIHLTSHIAVWIAVSGAFPLLWMKNAPGKLFERAPVNGCGIKGEFCTAQCLRFDPNKVAVYLPPVSGAPGSGFSTGLDGYS